MPATATPSTHMGYRADIDGLRAVAVLSVVGFHAFPGLLPGGFIGVDIFFVISGFLISSILFTDLERGRFSIARFYDRRVRRIFPALLTVLLVTVVCGWYIMVANEYAQLGRHVAGGAAFLSNFVLWSESGYFDNAAETKPLLHLWSLAIEEQFYLFWPLLLAFVWRRRWNFLKITLLLAVLSFAANIALVHRNPTAAFYSPGSRLWELMIGGILAYITLHRPDLNARATTMQSVVGFALLAGGAFLVESHNFPGWWALAPTLGTFLVISAGPASLVNRTILSNRVVVWFGLISYPLYLWHWPLLAYARILTTEQPSFAARVGVVGAAIVLAWVTTWLVERPVRFSGWRRMPAALVAAMAAGLSYGVMAGIEAAGPRNADPALEPVIAAQGDWEFPEGLTRMKNAPPGVFRVGDEERDETVFFGDSHVEQYSPRIVKTVTGRMGADSVVFVTSDGCPPIPGVFEDRHVTCARTRDFGLDLIRGHKVKRVVIGACWNCYFIEQVARRKEGGSKYEYYAMEGASRKAFRDGDGAPVALAHLEQLLRDVGRDKAVYLLLDNPSGAPFDPRTYFDGSRLGAITLKANVPSRVGVDAAQLALRAQLIAIARRANAIVLDPVAALCPGDNCTAVGGDGRPVYKDADHMRPWFVRERAAFIDLPIGNGAAAAR